MALTWREYDPFTGVTETNVVDEDSGKILVRKEQDVEGLLDRNKALANSGDTNIGIKKGLWHYASIPLNVQYELLTKYGINFAKKDHWPRMFDIINRDYPYLKTTSKHHAMRGGGQVFGALTTSPKPAS
jgi:hypothetical protein